MSARWAQMALHKLDLLSLSVLHQALVETATPQIRHMATIRAATDGARPLEQNAYKVRMVQGLLKQALLGLCENL